MRWLPFVAVFGLVGLCSVGLWVDSGSAGDKHPDAPSAGAPSKAWRVDNARRTAKMLDDIYKGGIVLITANYVTEESDLPAGKAFKALFGMVDKKGYHKVRFLDTTGEPINKENIPRKGFETKAVKQLMDGKSYYEEVMDIDGKDYYVAATPVPVVMNKCIMCHAHYENWPKGKPVGVLTYSIPLYPDQESAKK